MPKYSVVIPVYNSEKILPDLTRRLKTELRKTSGKYEIILVNDGSKDNSWETMQTLKAKNPRNIPRRVFEYPNIHMFFGSVGITIIITRHAALTMKPFRRNN